MVSLHIVWKRSGIKVLWYYTSEFRKVLCHYLLSLQFADCVFVKLCMWVCMWLCTQGEYSQGAC